MNEKQIERILNPKKRLIFLLLIYFGISLIFFGIVLYGKFFNKKDKKNILNLSEIVVDDSNIQEQYVKIDINTLPIFLAINGEDYLYYATSIDKHVYIVSLSNETFKNMLEEHNVETGMLNVTYEIRGTTNKIDDTVKTLAINNSNKVFGNNKINSDNFSEYLGNIYIKENSNFVSQRMVTLYICLALFGLFFLILAIFYILPAIIKSSSTLNDKNLMTNLSIELASLTETPYKKQHVYLTENYVIYGTQAVKYEDIEWAYILVSYSYGIKAGENLNLKIKGNKKHITIASVGPKSNVLDDILNDIQSKNENIKIGYNEENKKFFEN